MPRLKPWTRYLLLSAVSIAVVGARPSAESVLDREPGALRLIGVGLGSLLGDAQLQGELFADAVVAPAGSAASGSAAGDAAVLDQVADAITERFGDRAVGRARTLRR